MLTRRKILAGVLSSPFVAALPAWAASWVDLGIRQVSLTREVDRIDVVASRRFFERLRLAVTGNDIFLHTVTVHFANDVSVKYRFETLIEEGRKSPSIGLPGDGRRIRHVDLAYRRTPTGGTAIVTLQGLPK